VHTPSICSCHGILQNRIDPTRTVCGRRRLKLITLEALSGLRALSDLLVLRTGTISHCNLHNRAEHHRCNGTVSYEISPVKRFLVISGFDTDFFRFDWSDNRLPGSSPQTGVISFEVVSHRWLPF